MEDLLNVGGRKCETSADGKAAVLDPMLMAKECVTKAQQDDNVRDVQPGGYLRIQVLCDAVGFFRGGRMATHFGIRLVNLKRFHNAPYYSSNIAMYLSGDKHEELD
eukprot:5963477-Pleurochrysis_carterae.AAC.1